MNKKFIYTLTALLFILSAKAQDYSGYTKCAEQDSLALVAFYNATDGPNWKSNQDGFSVDDLSDDVDVYYTETYPNAGMGKWLEGPVKDWFGVLLEKQQVGNSTDSVWRVIHLHPTVARRSVGDNNLSGYIPREVGLLTALKWFKVNGNGGLEGSELPDEIYQPTLEAFDIEAAYFSGIISSEFRNCTNLSYINLRYNYLDSVPTFDFLSADQLLNMDATIWFYDNQISYATLEPTVTYFLSVGDIAYEMRNQLNVGREKEIIVSEGETVTLTCNEAGEQGTYETWKKDGSDRYTSGNTYTISNFAVKDTGAYTTVIENDYIRLNDDNSTYNTCITKPIYVRLSPTNPTLSKAETSYSGNEITLEFSKLMAVPSSSQASEFSVTSGGKAITVESIFRTGRLNDTYELTLAESVLPDEDVTVSYTPGTVTCKNGGILQTFTGKMVTNLVREAPVVESAKTRTDGSGIFITFDKFIDPETLTPDDFVVNSTTSTSISSVVLSEGEIDDDISKTIELVLSEALIDTDEITVAYNKGSLTGLYGGAVQSFDSVSVENVIEVNRQKVTFTVEDGTKSLPEIVLYGIKSTSVSLYDDGTNGDETSDDGIWSRTLQLTSGSYSWSVYYRTTTITYDSVQTVNDDGTISITLTPNETYSDSLISDEELVVEVDDNGYSGTTFYGYRNNTVVFILDISNYVESADTDTEISPYLMGINDDWTTGILMTEYDGSEYTYETSVGEYNIDDEIDFNFRINDVWENDSPEQRTHTVAGNDTIYASFGVLTGVEQSINAGQFKIYPNPAGDKLFLSVPDNETIKNIKITDLYGRCVLLYDYSSSSIDISQLSEGLYMMRIIDENNNSFNKKFLKAH